MEHVPERERRRALALAITVIALVAYLLFAIPAKADGLVLICPKDEPCTPETARIVFLVKVEDDRLPSSCLIAANSKTAEVGSMIGDNELVRIKCGR